MGYWIAAAALIGTAVSTAQKEKTDQQNKGLAQESNAEAAERRKVAKMELDKAGAAYNQFLSERTGGTFEDWRDSYVSSITDPKLAESFRNIKKDDFEFSIKYANQATTANTANFLKSRDLVSQGAAFGLTEKANEIALGSDTSAALKRAMELRAGYIPTGTVRYDSQGRLVEGQRADKQVFTASYETDAENKNIQFERTKQLLSAYSTIADRQSEKAKDFLQFASLEPIARELSTNAMKANIGFEMQDSENQFDLIKLYAAAASGIQPTQPNFASTAAYDKAISDGISTAVKGIGNYYNKKNGNEGTSTYLNSDSSFQSSFNSDGTY